MRQAPNPHLAPARCFWTEYWHGLYATPRAWAHKGERLVHAFEAVAEATVDGSLHLDMRDQALMLAGMGIEVLLKAIIVNPLEARNIVSASTSPPSDLAKTLWRAFYSHDLVNLAKEARVALTEEQANTAAALSQYIYWRGRYVLPTERGIDDLLPVKRADGLVRQPHLDATVETARSLVWHVIEHVKARLYGGA